jgi:hypothetical protein
VSTLGNREAVRMDMSRNGAIRDHSSGSKPKMHSFESVWRISCSKFEHCAMVANRPRRTPCMRRAVDVPGSEHCDADSLSRQSATLGSGGREA